MSDIQWFKSLLINGIQWSIDSIIQWSMLLQYNIVAIVQWGMQPLYAIVNDDQWGMQPQYYTMNSSAPMGTILFTLIH